MIAVAISLIALAAGQVTTTTTAAAPVTTVEKGIAKLVGAGAKDVTAKLTVVDARRLQICRDGCGTSEPRGMASTTVTSEPPKAHRRRSRASDRGGEHHDEHSI